MGCACVSMCMCVRYMLVSMCDCCFKFWHPSLILGVVKCTVNKQKRGSPHPSHPSIPMPRLLLSEAQTWISSTQRGHWVTSLCVCEGGECVGIEAFVLSRPPNLALSAPLLFWVRQKSGLFWDLCPGLSTDWTNHIHSSQSEEDSAPGAGCEAPSWRDYLALAVRLMWGGFIWSHFFL